MTDKEKIENINLILTAYDSGQYEDDYEVLGLVRTVVEDGEFVPVEFPEE